MNYSMGMDSHDISNDSIGDVSNDTEINVINLKKIKKDRGALNVFTLNNFKNKEEIRQFLIKEEKDILSLEDNFENIIINNKIKLKKNKTKKKNK